MTNSEILEEIEDVIIIMQEIDDTFVVNVNDDLYVNSDELKAVLPQYSDDDLFWALYVLEFRHYFIYPILPYGVDDMYEVNYVKLCKSEFMGVYGDVVHSNTLDGEYINYEYDLSHICRPHGQLPF